jgi:7-cyano-7-deazaguanine synthase in queuosine biosynthesis
MFSGGIDSTGVLHQLFTNERYADYNLIVHHIHIINRENRALAEANAVKNILTYYQKNISRDITYTESTFNTVGFAPLKARRFPYDMDVCAFFSGNICSAREDITFVAMGRTKTDVGVSGESFLHRMERAQKIFKSVLSLEKRETDPEYIFPVLDYNKKEIWEFLPEAVRSNTWYCRRPVYQNETTIPCGKCETCLAVQNFNME